MSDNIPRYKIVGRKVLEDVPEEMHYELLSIIGEYTVDLSLEVDETKTLVKNGHASYVSIKYSIVDDEPIVVNVEETFIKY